MSIQQQEYYFFNSEMKPPFLIVRCFASRYILLLEPVSTRFFIKMVFYGITNWLDIKGVLYYFTWYCISFATSSFSRLSLCANILPLKIFLDVANDIVPIPALSLLLQEEESKLILSEDSVSSSLYFISYEDSSNRIYMLCRSWQSSRLLSLCQ